MSVMRSPLGVDSITMGITERVRRGVACMYGAVMTWVNRPGDDGRCVRATASLLRLLASCLHLAYLL